MCRLFFFFFFSSRRRHTRSLRDWSSDVCSSDLSDMLSESTLGKVQALRRVATRRGQTLAQMALAWTLRDPVVTSTLIGASSVAQLEDNLGALANLGFDADELAEIDRYATEAEINIWATSSDA